MATRHIQNERIKRLNDEDPRPGDYILYWMQQSQRAEFNHALEFAVRKARDRGQPLLVVFGLMDDYPEANLRHYQFMLEGLRDVKDRLERRGIHMAVRHGPPDQVALECAEPASLVVCDRGYLKHQRAWRQNVAKNAGCEVWQVESDLVIPIDEASGKQEFAARTLRPKIERLREEYLVDLAETPVKRDSLDLRVEGFDLSDITTVLSNLKLDRSVGPVSEYFEGGTQAAKRILRKFLKRRFEGYDEHRNQPQTDYVSHMSKYLHFGQISPVQISLEMRAREGDYPEERASFLEELIVRRELAHNFVYFNSDYDSFRCVPDWAQQTLEDHREDEREHVYTRQQLEDAETHDPYWNAAMREMRFTGYMHNYMRMYWGKKILEWSNTPEHAHRTALAINNKYFLDGRDANSFANIAWIFGLHDRPFQERPVYGKVRSMTAGGLERKCDIEGYVRKVNALVGKAKSD